MGVRQRMRSDLKIHMKNGNRAAVAAIRNALAAIDNAEAVAGQERKSLDFRVGLGAGDAERAELTESDMMDLVAEQLEELCAALSDYGTQLDEQRQAELRVGAGVLAAYVGE